MLIIGVVQLSVLVLVFIVHHVILLIHVPVILDGLDLTVAQISMNVKLTMVDVHKSVKISKGIIPVNVIRDIP
jgi:hypothetical protein